MSIVNYIKDSFFELKNNVTWSLWSEVQRLTVIVSIFSVLFALATWGADEILKKVIMVFFSWIK